MKKTKANRSKQVITKSDFLSVFSNALPVHQAEAKRLLETYKPRIAIERAYNYLKVVSQIPEPPLRKRKSIKGKGIKRNRPPVKKKCPHCNYDFCTNVGGGINGRGEKFRTYKCLKCERCHRLITLNQVLELNAN